MTIRDWPRCRTGTRGFGPSAEPNRFLVNDCAGSCLPPFFTQLELHLEHALPVRAVELLREDPGAITSVSRWAKRLGVSREHLTRSFAPTISAHALLQAARVALAVACLTRQERFAVTPALDAMGYSSQSHAYAVFKRTTGLTPRRLWRRAHNRERPLHGPCVMKRCPLLGALLRNAEARN